VLEELTSRILRPQDHDAVIADLTRDELVEQLVVLIHEGRIPRAVALAQRAVDALPYDPMLQTASAFCLIPSEPRRAVSLLERISGGSRIEAPLLLANRICAHIVLGEWDRARVLVAHLKSDPGDLAPWLWVADSLIPGGAPRIEQVGIVEWVQRVEDLVDSLGG